MNERRRLKYLNLLLALERKLIIDEKEAKKVKEKEIRNIVYNDEKSATSGLLAAKRRYGRRGRKINQEGKQRNGRLTIDEE